MENCITYEQLLTLPYNEYGHLLQKGYTNIDGDSNFFGTSEHGKRIIRVNANYCGLTFIKILEDGGTRTVFNGQVNSFEELKLINSLVL